jgi:hypothetical protein
MEPHAKPLSVKAAIDTINEIADMASALVGIDEKTLRKSGASVAAWQDPSYRESQRKAADKRRENGDTFFHGRVNAWEVITDDGRARHAEKNSKRWEDAAFRESTSAKLKASKQTVEYKEKMGSSMTASFAKKREPKLLALDPICEPALKALVWHTKSTCVGTVNVPKTAAANGIPEGDLRYWLKYRHPELL